MTSPRTKLPAERARAQRGRWLAEVGWKYPLALLLIFYAVHVLALGMVAWFHRSFRGRSLWLQAILGLLLGGSIGNLIDRIRQGYVTDFISVGFGDVRFPTWNVADAGITTGIILLVAYLVLLEPRRTAESEA